MKKITEDEFLKQVITLAKRCGWLACHFRAAMTQSGRWITPVQGDGKGFPDLVLVKGIVVFAETKVPPNKATPEQLIWLERLRKAGQQAYLWTPEDWPQIEEVIGEGRILSSCGFAPTRKRRS